ncbi:MAG: hypothetical protein C4521_02260 [Actinobacteria bacterium]|nr:MAG: hypothetical protein C4521_02260 [Actinomycetota bacterium]
MADEQMTAGRPGPQSDSNRILAALGYPIWIVALVMVLTEPGKTDPFVKYHGWQALFYGIAVFIIGLVPFIGWIASFVLWVVSIYFAIQAYNGKYFEVPVIYGLAKKQMED